MLIGLVKRAIFRVPMPLVNKDLICKVYRENADLINQCCLEAALVDTTICEAMADEKKDATGNFTGERTNFTLMDCRLPPASENVTNFNAPVAKNKKPNMTLEHLI